MISDERFNKIILNDLQSANYIAERDTEKVYLGTELKGHIFQEYLPGQMLTLNGKYYELISVTSDNQVILRRASEFIGGRPAYRQVRKYTFRHITDSESMGALRSINHIDIYNQFADFSVETPAYWKLNSYQDLKHGKLTELNGIPRRDYCTKQLLKLDFSKLGDVFTDEIRYTLTSLLNEIFRTLFADNQPYIVALTPGDPGLPITYTIEAEEGILSEKAIYIVEDSQLDVGLLVSVERNLERILQIVADYLKWNEEQIEDSRRVEEERRNPPAKPSLDIPGEGENGEEGAEGADGKDGKKKKGLWARIKAWFKKVGDKIKGIFKRKKKRRKGEPEEIPAEGTPAEGEIPAEGVIAAEGEIPAEEAPVAEVPEETPSPEVSEEVPEEEHPTEVPSMETPEEESVTETPLEETSEAEPVTEASGEISEEEVPAEETPAEGTPLEGAPVEETPSGAVSKETAEETEEEVKHDDGQ